MSIFSVIKPAWEVLQAGKELKHAAAWKNVQLVALVLTSLASLATAFGVDLGLTQEQILGTAGTIAAIAAYFVPATSAKVGISTRPSEDEPRVGAVRVRASRPLLEEAPETGALQTGALQARPSGVSAHERLPELAEPVQLPKAGADPEPGGRGSYDDWAGDH